MNLLNVMHEQDLEQLQVQFATHFGSQFRNRAVGGATAYVKRMVNAHCVCVASMKRRL
jgi:hypothetical protein